MNEERTPRAALQLLDGVCAQVKADRAEHVRIEAASELILKALARLAMPAEDICADSDDRAWLDDKISLAMTAAKVKGGRSAEGIAAKAVLDALQDVRVKIFGESLS